MATKSANTANPTNATGAAAGHNPARLGALADERMRSASAGYSNLAKEVVI